ncbi:MAG: S1C family serine protease [Acidimicrobiia bacterium]
MPGDTGDDEGSGPPPHPFDRPWIHPSELFAESRAAPAPAAEPATRHWRRDALLTIAAGAVGAVAAVAVLAIVGTFDRNPRVVTMRARTTDSTDAARVATLVSPGVASVVIDDADGSEHRGSGIAVGAHQILTTIAVIDGAAGSADHIEVSLTNGRWHAARELGRDTVTGLVLLEVPTLSVEPTQLASTVAVQPGEWVVAVGRNAANAPWVTTGVVTATGGFATDASGITRAGMITTSAELASEARGGALVDQHGRVVGVLVGPNPLDANGTAIPGETAHDVTVQLANKGRASHGALGLLATDTREPGATVTAMTAGASAAKAGLRVGDRILAVDADATPDTARLVYELHRRSAGERVRITVARGKDRVSMTASLQDAVVPPGSPAAGSSPTSIQPIAASGTG